MRRVRFWIAPVVMAMAAGCTSAPVASVEAAPPQPKPPIRIGVLVDKTLSATWTRVPAVTVADFEPLIRLVGERGGEIAVGLIRDRSNRGLRRLPVSPRPAAPAEPNSHQNPFLLAEARARHEADRRAYEAALADWQSELDQRLAAFRKDLSELLALPADARRTDLWDAIRRAELFLNEPQSASRPAPQNWLLLLTDGKDNVGRPTVALRSKARLLVINGSAAVGELAELNPVAFESFSAAVAYLVAEEAN